MRRKIPSITALLCFEAAGRTENFAQAAQMLNMSQSAFGRQIQSLEAQVGQTLFHRERQRVRLSQGGQVLLAELSPHLEAIEAPIFRLRTRDNPFGALNIGTYPTLGSRWLMPRLSQLNKSQPKLTINTITYLDNTQIDASVVDLAIAQGDPPWPGFRADPLMHERLVAVVSPELRTDSVRSPLDLLEMQALQHRSRPLSWKIWFDSLGIDLPMTPTGPLFSQFEMLIDATRLGHGVAILPELLIRRELESGQLIPAHPHRCQPDSAYFLLTPQAKIGTNKVERVRSWLLEQGAQDME
jgi:DNA-binding transcriptional LysR family regulator